jgi:ligand-binding SRPBCC domain-containing protein
VCPWDTSPCVVVMRFVAETLIRAEPERVFAFHELPDALERLTPSWAGSRVVEHVPSLHVGSRAVVEIRVAPLFWYRAELTHTVYDPPRIFVDEQATGPFRFWRHEHRVTLVAGGARLSDIVEYEPPFGAVGRVLAPILIHRRLRRLFAYRHRVTREWCERVE